MARIRLAFITFGSLVALFVLVLAVPLGGAVGAAVFAAVVALVGIWYFRFAPWGDLWDSADELDVRPWWLLAAILLLGAAWSAFRFVLLAAAT